MVNSRVVALAIKSMGLKQLSSPYDLDSDFSEDSASRCCYPDLLSACSGIKGGVPLCSPD